MPLLITALDNAQVRKLAVHVLITIGPAAQEAVPALEKQRTDPDPGYRGLVEAALFEITHKTGPD